MMLKDSLIHLIVMKIIKDRFQQVKIKKIIGLFKDELGGKIMTKFVALRAKTYLYLMEDGKEHKKSKGTKRCVIELETIFQNYEDSLFNDEIILFK